MKTNLKNYLTLVLFIVITPIGFFLWVGGLFFIWLLFRMTNINTDFWAMVEALSTAVTVAAFLSAGFIAYKELSEVTSSRHMDITDRLFEELNSDENIEARRWIFQNLPSNPEEGIESMPQEGFVAVKQVLNSLDHVAFLTQSGWIPDEIIMPWMHPMIAKSWEKLEPYLSYERMRRNEPYYYRHVSELGERCREWRAKNLTEIEVTWIDNAL